MTTLLTKGEYQAIASALEFPTTAFIDGGYRNSTNGDTLDSINPATGELIAKVSSCSSTDVDFAVAKARESFDDGRWRTQHPAERKSVLVKLAKLMTRNSRELAVMESQGDLTEAKKCF